jgi:threonine dehydrogenase-like Zn-dependent dehydrogenase
MRALTWHGKEDVRVSEVPDPEIVNPHDAIVEITATAICGSDLHLYDDYVPTMREGDVLGHEPMGEVVEVGEQVENLEVGDRVVVPFTISCGSCWFCEEDLYSLCDNSNPNAEIARKVMGQSPAGLFGYSHMMGGYAGGQAEYLRVPYADVGPVKVESDLPDEQVLFLSAMYPVGNTSDGIHGRRGRRHRGGRHRRGVGLRPGRPVRHPERVDARCRSGRRHRPRA